MPDSFRPLDQAAAEVETDSFRPLETVKEPPKAEPQKKSWMRTIGEGILPTAGAVGGGTAGGLITSPSIMGIPAGVLAGEMGGAALGEQANQWLGITEPSKGAVLASGLAAPIGRGVMPAAKGLLGLATKTFAGRDIMSEAASNLVRKMMAPARSAADLFQEARELNFFIPAIRTPQVIDELITQESKAAPTGIRDQIRAAIAPLKAYFVPSRGEINAFHATDMLKEEQRLREIAGKSFDVGDNHFANAINKIRAAMLDDLERSGAGVVKEASRAYRKEMALDDISKLFGKPHPVQKIADFAKDNPLFRGAFDNQEMAQINRIAKKLATVPASGGSGVWGRTITGSLGFEAGGPIGAAVGALSPDAIKAVLRTQFGRNYAERILGSSPQLSNEAVAALAVFARGMTGRPPKEPQAELPAAAQQ